MYFHEIVDTTQDQFPFKIIIHKNGNGTIPKHWHRSLELSFTLKGKIDAFTINGKVYSPREGTILVINPNDVHSVSASTKKGEENLALSLLIPYSLMQEALSDYPYRTYYLPSMEDQTAVQRYSYQKMLTIAESLYRYMEKPTKNTSFKILSLVYDILYELSENFSFSRTLKNDLQQNTSNEFEWIDDVILYIQRHLTTPLTVNDLADRFYLTPSYFSRKFKKYMGIAVMEYVNEIRLREAFQQIVHTQKKIQAISDSCGFPNHKSFIRIFKKAYGITPIQYRKKLRSHK